MVRLENVGSLLLVTRGGGHRRRGAFDLSTKSNGMFFAEIN